MVAWGLVGLLNLAFLRFLGVRGGLGFGILGYALHLLHFTAAGLGAAWGLAGHAAAKCDPRRGRN